MGSYFFTSNYNENLSDNNKKLIYDESVVDKENFFDAKTPELNFMRDVCQDYDHWLYHPDKFAVWVSGFDNYSYLAYKASDTLKIVNLSLNDKIVTAITMFDVRYIKYHYHDKNDYLLIIPNSESSLHIIRNNVYYLKINTKAHKNYYNLIHHNSLIVQNQVIHNWNKTEITIYDLITGETLREIKFEQETWINNIVYWKNNSLSFLILDCIYSINLLNLDTGKIISTISNNDQKMLTIEVSNNFLYAGCDDGIVIKFDLLSLERILSVRIYGEDIEDDETLDGSSVNRITSLVCWNNKYLLTSGHYGTTVINIEDFTIIGIIKEEAGVVDLKKVSINNIPSLVCASGKPLIKLYQ